MSDATVLGVYTSGRSAAAGAKVLRKARLGTVQVYSPTADDSILRDQDQGTSPIRIFALLGGIVGCAVGIALPLYTMLDSPFIVGGKPLISIPPLVIIGFELMMLGAALGSLAGFFLTSGLPDLRGRPLDDLRFTNDRYGVMVTCTQESRASVRTHLKQAGAEKVVDCE